jgi:hypothetical protein
MKSRGPSDDALVASYRVSQPAKDERTAQLKAKIEAALAENPRAAAAKFIRDRQLDTLISYGEPDAAADYALQCINARPDTADQIEYFSGVRARALLAAKRFPEALAAAKGYFNVCSLTSSSKAIDLLLRCWTAAHPDDQANVRKFRMQQLEGAEDVETVKSMLSQITIDPAIYTGKGLERERNGSYREIGNANLMLMKGQAAEAMAVFKRLADSGNPAGPSGMVRAAKAESGLVARGNEMLRAMPR